MKPTLFTIPFLPEWLADVKSYGVMMMIAFLSGIWLACRRAVKTQGNPDTVLNVGFISLVCGIIGARAMYVLHYWDTRFANRPNSLTAIFDISEGGLEFWGGPLLVIPAAIIYLKFIAKVSVRWYLDMVIPSLAWGLAVTRIGCFLNGCCWGAVCLDPHDVDREQATIPWAVQFPYGSPAMHQQYEYGQLTLPKELVLSHESGETMPWPRKFIDMALEDDGQTKRQVEKAEREKHEMAAKEREKYRRSAIGSTERQAETFGLSVRQLAQLSEHYRSKPVHPSQLYAVINAFLISSVLATMFYYRRRHGILLGWFLLVYSISRVFLEMIRADNPLDTFGGVTISQGISITTFAIGIIWLIIMHRLPTRSPAAVPFVYPEEEEPEPKKAKSKKK